MNKVPEKIEQPDSEINHLKNFFASNSRNIGSQRKVILDSLNRNLNREQTFRH